MALIPHTLVHTRDSVLVDDPSRRLRWAVHPLDAARNEDAAPRWRETATEAVERAIAASQVPGDVGNAREALLEAWEADPLDALRALMERLFARPGAWEGGAAAEAEARRREAPLLARLREPLPHGHLDALLAQLCDESHPDLLAPWADGLPSALRTRFEEFEKLPELPLRLAGLCIHGLAAGGPPRLATLAAQLQLLAGRWDPEYVEKTGEKDPKSPSQAALDAHEGKHLSTEQRAALAASRARRLFELAAAAAAMTSEVDWRGSSLRELYLELGDLADRLVEDHPREFGVGKALELLEGAGIVQGRRT